MIVHLLLQLGSISLCIILGFVLGAMWVRDKMENEKMLRKEWERSYCELSEEILLHRTAFIQRRDIERVDIYLLTHLTSKDSYIPWLRLKTQFIKIAEAQAQHKLPYFVTCPCCGVQVLLFTERRGE